MTSGALRQQDRQAAATGRSRPGGPTPALPRRLFHGDDGNTYEFYSIVRDLLGNAEVKEPLAEATTTVLLRPEDGDGDGVLDGDDRCADLSDDRSSDVGFRVAGPLR